MTTAHKPGTTALYNRKAFLTARLVALCGASVFAGWIVSIAIAFAI
jgi:hypothetical protein